MKLHEKICFFCVFCCWIWDLMSCRVMKCCHGLMVRRRLIWGPSQQRTWGYGFLKRHHLFWVIHRWIKELVKARATWKVADRGWRMIISLCHRLVLSPIPREEGFYGRNKQASVSFHLSLPLSFFVTSVDVFNVVLFCLTFFCCLLLLHLSLLGFVLINLCTFLLLTVNINFSKWMLLLTHV